MEAIRSFPIPGTLTDLRSFFALAEQVSFTFPIKLKEFVPNFFWDEKIASSVVQGRKTFDADKQTTLVTD